MTKIFVVTGSNKARNSTLGEAALAKLKSESNGKQVAEVIFHQLDITNDESCKKFVEYIKTTHGGLDVLINNAGILLDNTSVKSDNVNEEQKSMPVDVQAEVTMAVNYFGTKRITNALLSLIRPGGRIVILCSLMGLLDGTGYIKKFGLSAYSKTIQQKFKNPDFTEKDVNEFVEEFLRDEAESGKPKRKEGGYIKSAYSVSKAADIAYMISLASAVKDKTITVYGCCPGYCSTDLNCHSGNLSTDQGADTPIYLATEEYLQNGKFYYQRQVVPWPETNFTSIM